MDTDGRGRPSKSRVLLVAGLVLVAAAGVFVVTQMVNGGAAARPRPTRSAPATVPMPVTPGNSVRPSASAAAAYCPASSVRGVTASCPAAPECWNGIVVTAGSATAARLPCASAHVWQTFAIGTLPGSVHTYDQSVVAEDPMVRAVCSMRILLRSRTATARSIPSANWSIGILPPDQAAYAGGARGFRCLASLVPVTGTEPNSSQFGA